MYYDYKPSYFKYIINNSNIIKTADKKTKIYFYLETSNETMNGQTHFGDVPDYYFGSNLQFVWKKASLQRSTLSKCFLRFLFFPIDWMLVLL